MKIAKIKKLNSGKYKIELDNNEKIVTYDEVILNNNLLFNKEINNDLLNKLNNETSYYNIYNKVVKYIMVKIRSEYEIKEYLNKLQIDINDKNKILNQLKNNRLINDLAFLKAYISDKIRLSNDGPYKIKRDLLKHNIKEELINEELNNYDDQQIYDKLKELMIKKIKISHKYSNYILKQKINEYFINLGYSRDMIVSILNIIDLDNSESIKKDYKSLYNKLSKKYNNEELEYQIKQKLYKKGYSTEEINTIKKGC